MTRVEIKLDVRPTDEAELLAMLDVVDDLRRRVGFFETKTLALFERGVILRARKQHDGPADDVTVKLRGPLAEAIGPSWDGLAGFKREIDRAGTKETSSVSLTVGLDGDIIERAFAGKLAARELFDAEQVKLLAKAGEIPWDDLEVAGPVEARLWRHQQRGADLTVERWDVDGERFYEVSQKAEPSDAKKVDKRLRELLDGIEIVDAGTKTRAVLAQLQASKRS